MDVFLAEKVNISTKLIGLLTAFMALVFIATVPMLAYRYLLQLQLICVFK